MRNKVKSADEAALVAAATTKPPPPWLELEPEGEKNDLICSALPVPPCRRLKQLTKSWPHLSPFDRMNKLTYSGSILVLP